MRRVLAVAVAAVGAVVASAGTASAQNLEFKPIDTSKFLVQPTDAATNIFARTAQYFSRVVANTIDSDGYVKTINNLLGRTPPANATIQPGMSPLPLPGTYPSTGYKNSFQPAMPTYQIYGQTPGG
jgi:hypothetical protein